MSKKNNEFPAMIVIKEVLGIEEGTMIKFDPFSGKYVSLVEEEEVADEDIFYSGSAIAIDPYIVQAYVGDLFSPIEDKKPEKIEEKVEAIPGSEPLLSSEEGLGEVFFPEYKEKHPLVIDCSCGHRRLLDVVNAPGLSFSIMANDESSFIELECPACETSMRFWFAQEKEEVDELTEKESN